MKIDMDRPKSIAAKLLLHFSLIQDELCFPQSQYLAAFLINFSINLAMNFNHRTRQWFTLQMHNQRPAGIVRQEGIVHQEGIVRQRRCPSRPVHSSNGPL